MAIRRQRTYTINEIERILRASEGRKSLLTGASGHAGQRHVLASNRSLEDRAGTLRTSTPLVCAFVGTPEQIRAVTEALNSPEGQAALKYLDENYPSGIRVRLEAEVSAVAARYSSGFGITRTATVSSVRVILERSEEEAYYGLHIPTAFPTLFSEHGPAWQDNHGTWH